MIKNPTILFQTLLVSCISTVAFVNAEQLTNPVARCADCGVMKHRGTYYITGTVLPGRMLTSQNLTDWKGPVNFFQTKLNWTDKGHTIDMHAPSLKKSKG